LWVVDLDFTRLFALKVWVASFLRFSFDSASWIMFIGKVKSYIVCLYYEIPWGHLYLWHVPLLAPDSTVGKMRLVVVAVQGAPR